MRTAYLAILSVGLMACAGETDTGPAAGEVGGSCLPADVCDEGLMCVSGYCVPAIQEAEDAGITEDAEAHQDAEVAGPEVVEEVMAEVVEETLGEVAEEVTPEVVQEVIQPEDTGPEGTPFCLDYASVCGPWSGAVPCEEWFNAAPVGAQGDTDGATQGCYTYHLGLAALSGDPEVILAHCAHAVGGADAAGDAPCTEVVESVITAQITAPDQNTIVEPDDLVVLQGVVTDSVYGDMELAVKWEVEGGAVLGEGFAGPGGWTQLSTKFEEPGWHTVWLTVTNPAGQQAQDKLVIGTCSYGEVEGFDEALEGSNWQTYGDAFWASGGWLEMTGNAQFKQGAIFDVVQQINPGDVEFHVSIWTGGAEGFFNSGADGFAMSVFNVDTVEELEEVIDYGIQVGQSWGGCLGYGVSGPCGDMEVEAFHVEFDTYPNTGTPNTDPTSNNHIAITLDGNPSNHLVWSEYYLEDKSWHDVVVKTEDNLITVYVDGSLIVSEIIPAFQFHGGYIGFTGVTGNETNYHRVDNLLVVQSCTVP